MNLINNNSIGIPQINHSITFVDVFILGINNQNLTFQTYHRLTYTGLFLNFKSFTSFSCNISLIKCLIDMSFKICNTVFSLINSHSLLNAPLQLTPSMILKIFYKCPSLINAPRKFRRGGIY